MKDDFTVPLIVLFLLTIGTYVCAILASGEVKEFLILLASAILVTFLLIVLKVSNLK